MKFRQAHILILTDEVTDSNTLLLLLRDADFSVVLAKSEAEALELLQQHNPALILCDCQLSSLWCYQFCARLKQQQKTAGIVLLLASYFDSEERLIQALYCGADGLIGKPYQQAYLCSRLEYFLQLPKSRPEQAQMAIELRSDGDSHFITAGRRQLLALLHSTYQQLMLQPQHSIPETVISIPATEQQVQMRIQTQAMHASVNAVIITDNQAPDQPIIYVNPAFEQLTGYSSAEVLGKNCRFLQGSAQQQPGLDLIRRAIRYQDKITAELLNYRKDGSSFWNELTLAPVLDEQGKASHYVGMLRDVTETKNYRQELEYQANYDSLTGLPNRNLLHDRLQQAIAYAKRNRRSFTLALLDIDHFKVINDSLGHQAGDELLQQIAQRLTAQLRDTDTVARSGGDEFVLVLTDPMGFASHIRRLERLKRQLLLPANVAEQELVVNFSMGVCRYPQDGDSCTTLLRHVDTALFEAKQLGRNRICMFKPEMNQIVQQRLQMEQAIRQGLLNQEFLVYYQPQADLNTGRICGLEALVRWSHNRQMIAPGAFIYIAEQSGLITELDFFVFGSVCRQISLWQHELKGLVVAVNFSALSFMDAQFVARVRSALQQYQVAPGAVMLEMTESTLMHDADEALQKMQELKALGIRFSIDDFGTSYSSLAYLKRFPFSQLKIDGSFITDVHTEPDSAALVKSMISMAHNLGIRVLAEGVETVEQLGFLLKAGCDEIQGYFYAQPQPVAHCAELLQHKQQLQLPSELYANGRRCLLLVDSEQNVLSALKRELRPLGYQLLLAQSAEQGMAYLATCPVDVVLTDLRLCDTTGVEFLQKVRALYPDVVRMVLSATTEISGILKAVNECVIYRFITKPWEPTELKTQLAEAFRLRALQLDNERMKAQLRAPGSAGFHD